MKVHKIALGSLKNYQGLTKTCLTSSVLCAFFVRMLSGASWYTKTCSELALQSHEIKRYNLQFK